MTILTMALRIQSKRARHDAGERCPSCKRVFARLRTHLAADQECQARVDATERDNQENRPPENGVLDSFLEDADACEVADGLTDLKYERGFQRPDIEAAKQFAGIVAKRARAIAFTAMQGLLRPDVDRVTFEAGELPACLPDMFRSVPHVFRS